MIYEPNTKIHFHVKVKVVKKHVTFYVLLGGY